MVGWLSLRDRVLVIAEIVFSSVRKVFALVHTPSIRLAVLMKLLYTSIYILTDGTMTELRIHFTILPLLI